MNNRVQTTVFSKKQGCVPCEQTKVTLRDAGMVFFTSLDVESEQRNANAAVYFSGKATTPQVFLGDYPLGGAEELEKLWKTRRLRDIAQAVDSQGSLQFELLSDEQLARGAEDLLFKEFIPPSDGFRSDDPEQWPILHLYKQIFGFWPNTFVYLHHSPEIYKRFVYCQNMAAIQSGLGQLAIPLLAAVGYATSNAHGCNYCQVHTVATGGDESMMAVEQYRLARIGERDSENPFDEYWLSLADLAAMATLNEVPEGYVARLRQLASKSDHQPKDPEAQVQTVALISASFGFLNVFNDLVGMDIEGKWASTAHDRLGLDHGRHEVNEQENPNNLAYELPVGGPTPQEIMGKYAAEVGDLAAFSEEEFGLMLPWIIGYPVQMRPLHAAFYAEVMRPSSTLTSEFKHLMAYVCHVEKGHEVLAASEAFMAHHVSANREQTIERLKHGFAVASGRGGNEALYTAAEKAALRLAYLSAQMPLITPRRFVEPVVDHFETQDIIELFSVCAISSMVQRLSAIVQAESNGVIETFMQESGLPADVLAMRFPLPS